MADFRTRIYRGYVHARQQALVPRSVGGFRTRAAYLRKLIREHFPADRNASVLDLGCGHGTLLFFLREAGYRNVVGIDCSAEQVAAAKTLGIDGVEQADVAEYIRSVASQSQDVVVTFDLIEHLNKAELLEFVDQVCRLLKPRGRWVMHVPNGESPFGGRVRYGDLTHEQAFTTESLAQLALSSGFGSISFFEDSPVPHGVISAIRWVLWKLIRIVLRAYMAVETGGLGRGCIFSQNLTAVAVK